MISDPLSEQHRHLERHIRRLEGRIQALDQHSRRFSWLRLGIVVATAIAVWIAASRWDNYAGWGVLAAGVAVFAWIAYLHRRLDGWIQAFHLWREIQQQQAARLELNWAALPEPALPPDRKCSSLDIDLDLSGPRSLHHLIDVSVSREGSHLLLGWLTKGIPDPEQIQPRQALVQELAPLRRFRQRLLLIFRQTAAEALEGEKMRRWLAQPVPAGRLRWTLPVASVWVVANILLFVLNSLGQLPPFWTLSLALYAVFYYYNQSTIGAFLDQIVELDRELDKFRAMLRYLENYPLRRAVHLEKLLAPFRGAGECPSRQLRRVKLATAMVGLRMNYVTGLLLNLILPWDFVCAWLAARERQSVSRVLPGWLDIFHQLEALISLANFADLNPGCSYPVVDGVIDARAQPVLQCKSIGHPLIPAGRRVCNDFTIPALGEAMIVTGSNMAGKSTFIKTIGINLCLAYAGGPVIAAEFSSLPFRLHTCMRISDSIADGYSYFYAEVRCLKSLLEELADESQPPLLYLIDEIFRGTNNRERLIGSRAYLNALVGRRGAGLIATHDLELASLAEQRPQVHNFHFRDAVQDGQLTFDYLIRPGPSPTTNALKIMALEGLPVEIGEL